MYACSHMGTKQLKISDLPEDLPPITGLQSRFIELGDYRTGLTPGKDMAVYATQSLPANSVLGVYRCIAITDSEESDMKHNTPEAFPGCNAQWRQALDMYAAEIAPPVPRTWGKRLLAQVFDEALEVSLRLSDIYRAPCVYRHCCKTKHVSCLICTSMQLLNQPTGLYLVLLDTIPQLFNEWLTSSPFDYGMHN